MVPEICSTSPVIKEMQVKTLKLYDICIIPYSAVHTSKRLDDTNKIDLGLAK